MALTDIGILLTNIGTPANPSAPAVRRYLKKFLSDPRVIELPKLIWQPILHGLILPFRPARTAKLYQKIWGPNGSPLLYYSKRIAEKLQTKLQLPVALGMHYSTPTIEEALVYLRSQKINKILVLPLYPHYSATTTAATFDQAAAIFKKWRNVPEVRTIHSYSNDLNFSQAIECSIRKSWERYGRAKHLLFSFHGLPKRYITAGDQYADLCHTSVRQITACLNLPQENWSLSFQSRLSTGWLTPYTDKVLKSLPKKGITDLQVVCPGFAVDCLETLEEIAIRGKEQFLKAGGKLFHYVAALNDSEIHINMLTQIVNKHTQGW